jgi:outer membrane protein TolC
MERKRSGGSRYYDYIEGELKVPTPIGSDLKLGYERAVGTRIANDRYTGAPGGNSGIVTLGMSVPIGQRLLTDERRTALAQARALQEVAEADRAAAVNRLLLAAAKDYATWYEAHRRRQVAREGVSLAEFRLRAVRARVARGEAAPIDTVEGLLEVQRREVQRLEAEQVYYATALGVAAYLWDERTDPLDLAADVVPSLAGLEAQPVDSAMLPRWLELAQQRHPELRRAAGRVDQAAAQRRLQAQQIIPLVEGAAYALAPQTEFGALGEGARFGDNHKASLLVRTPLLFLRERGRFNAASQRLEVQELDATRLRREIALAVREAVNDLATVHATLGLQRLAVRQSRQLLVGEQRRFENGESQLLVVNLRERLVLEEELKLAALEAKFAGARAGLAVALGEPARLP